jgi:hypothetical protein
MAARLKQVGRDQKRVAANAARRVLRRVVKAAQGEYTSGSTIGRKLWGGAFWTGRKHTLASLGLSSRTKWYNRTGGKWSTYHRDWRRGSDKAARVRSKGGSGIPLIVHLGKSRWTGNTWRSAVQARGVAGNLEAGQPFKPHKRHPGGRVPRRPALEPALRHHEGQIGGEVKRDMNDFMAGAIGG